MSAPSSTVVTTKVTLTGTGVPPPSAHRAGSGVLVQRGPLALQFDAGRGTTMRLAALGLRCSALSALFVTHHHSDHLSDVHDVVISRWLDRFDGSDLPLPVVAPEGAPATFVRHVMDIWAEELALRQEHTARKPCPAPDVIAFHASPQPAVVWEHDQDVQVSAVAVHHAPAEPAVAYRVETPEGGVVISGDTIVCEEVERLAHGAKVLVHEAMRTREVERGQSPRAIVDYHADTFMLGAMAARLAVPTLVLTHLIPSPSNAAEATAFEADVRHAGYEGRVVVGDDLAAVIL